MFNIVSHLCICCQTQTPRKLDLCAACQKDLPWYYRTGSTILATMEYSCISGAIFPLFRYQSPIDFIISQIKFGNNLIYAQVLGTLLAEHLEEKYQNCPKPEVIIPVPLHHQRLSERGYNQALELVRTSAKRLKIPINKYCCMRQKATQAQSTLPASERHGNVKNAFALVKEINYQYVAVIDDVITTGSTVTALCEVLAKAGVGKIDVWCIAKTVQD